MYSGFFVEYSIVKQRRLFRIFLYMLLRLLESNRIMVRHINLFLDKYPRSSKSEFSDALNPFPKRRTPPQPLLLLLEVYNLLLNLYI